MNTISEKSLKRGRTLYIIEAALEYLLSIFVSGSFLARLTAELDLSDSLTGVISSVISLGCVFELLSVFFLGKRVKPLVVLLSILNQVLFILLYVIPVTGLSPKAKTAAFIVMILLAYVIYYAVHPKKINWLMSLVEDPMRGRFTAVKEMVSLAAGIVFSFGMGRLIDDFRKSGHIRTAFILSAAVMGILMLLHTVTMLLTVEKPSDPVENRNFRKRLNGTGIGKDVLTITLFMVFYSVSSSVSTCFYGTYQIRELGFSQTPIVTMASAGAVSRILVSPFWGWYADRFSFAKMIRLCLAFQTAAYLAIVFAVPSNGFVCFCLYNIFSGVAMGGLNSGLINLVYDYVPPEKRADSLAVSQAFSGAAGFLSTLAVSPVITRIQNAGNRFFGFPVYAQQLLSAVSVVMTLVLIIFMRTAFPQKTAK